MPEVNRQVRQPLLDIAPLPLPPRGPGPRQGVPEAMERGGALSRVRPDRDWLGGRRGGGGAHVGTPPEGSAERTLVTVDGGSAERVGDEELVKAAPRVINIDHHGDNTRFGDENLVAGDASSTAEILYYILKQLDVEITPEIGEALYTGILVDSGRFQYSSASPSTFRVAADLIEAGVDHTAIFRHIYETVPLDKSSILCRLLTNMTIACEGKLAIGGASETDSERAEAGNGLTGEP